MHYRRKRTSCRDWARDCLEVPMMPQGSPKQDGSTFLQWNYSSQLKHAIFWKAGCFPCLNVSLRRPLYKGRDCWKKKKKWEKCLFPPLCFWDSLITHISLVKRDYKSIQAIWKVPVNGISTSDCYETHAEKRVFLWNPEGYFCKENTGMLCGIKQTNKPPTIWSAGCRLHCLNKFHLHQK